MAASCVLERSVYPRRTDNFLKPPDRIDYASSKTNAEIKRRNRDFDVHYFTKRDGKSGRKRKVVLDDPF